MQTASTGDDRVPTEHLARGAGVIALAVVAVIHVLDLPDTLAETPLIGAGFFLVIGGALTGATLLMTLPGPRVWVLADLIGTGALIAYVLSRTTGLPTDAEDIGNWNCTLGIAALSTEALLVLLAAWRMQQPRRRLLRPVSARGVSAEPRVAETADSTH